jgi:hypothetical protein
MGKQSIQLRARAISRRSLPGDGLSAAALDAGFGFSYVPHPQIDATGRRRRAGQGDKPYQLPHSRRRDS